jgi:GntR family histidine utilization transcriptional repressor
MSLATDRVKAPPAGKPTLYKQIRSDIERRILTGEWPPGYRIPYEHQLMTRYGCSRMTVSKALSELAQGDLIERRRRAGTFVRRPRFLSAVLQISDIRAEITALGRRYGYQLIKRARRAATADDRARLGLRTPA